MEHHFSSLDYPLSEITSKPALQNVRTTVLALLHAKLGFVGNVCWVGITFLFEA